MARPELYPENVYIRMPLGTMARITALRGTEPSGEFIRRTLLAALEAGDGIPSPDVSRAVQAHHELVLKQLFSQLRRAIFESDAHQLLPGAEASVRAIGAMAVPVSEKIRQMGADVLDAARSSLEKQHG